MFLSESLVRAIEADRAREIERSGRNARLLDSVSRTTAGRRSDDFNPRADRTRPARGADRTCEPA